MKDMRPCCICHKNVKNGNVAFFKIPKDERRRKKWSDICGLQLTNSDGICGKHFLSSDIVKENRKFLLLPDAVPVVDSSERKQDISNLESNDSQVIDFTSCIPEYVHINTVYDTANRKCRCCTNPTSNLIQLDKYIKSNEGLRKTYKDLLYEITNLRIPINDEHLLPQQICSKCEVQLKNSYKFIQQTCQLYQRYLKLVEKQNIQHVKNIEHLQESLIEITDSFIEHTDEALKIEPLNLEYNLDLKQENVHPEILTSKNFNYKECEKERDLHNFSGDDNSSENEEGSIRSESLHGIEQDVNEPIAICCDICQKVYRNEKFLKIHKRYTHMPEENKLPCPLCGYKASRTSALKVHISLVHGPDKVNEYLKPVIDSNKKYPCGLCPRSYGRKDSLRKHARRKHINMSPKEEIPEKSKAPKMKEKQCFLCTYCGQSYNTKSGLKSHALTHTGERPFLCEICNKTFKRLKDLQLHRVIHSDEKPHQCSQCGKAFKRADKLKIHMRVHSELRPYRCRECDKSFKYPSVLRTHMRIHTGQTPFTCKTCDEAFSLRTSLNNHCLKNDHVK